MLQNIEDGSGFYPASCSMTTVGSSPGVLRPGWKIYHSPPPSAKVKNGWSWTFALTVRLYNVDRQPIAVFYFNM